MVEASELSSIHEQEAMRMKGKAKIEALKKLNQARRAEDTMPAEAFADLKARLANKETLRGSLVPTEDDLTGAETHDEENTGVEAAGEIDVSGLRAELAGKKETREITPETKLDDSGREEAMTEIISPEVIRQVRARDEQRIAEVRQAIGQIGEEETSAASPWNPTGEGPRFGGSAAEPAPQNDIAEPDPLVPPEEEEQEAA